MNVSIAAPAICLGLVHSQSETRTQKLSGFADEFRRLSCVAQNLDIRFLPCTRSDTKLLQHSNGKRFLSRRSTAVAHARPRRTPFARQKLALSASLPVSAP